MSFITNNKKYIVILFCIVAAVFFGNLKLNNIANNFISNLEKENYQVDFSSIEKSFFIYKNYITIRNLNIEKENELTIKIKDTKIHLNLFSMIFSSNKKIDLIDMNLHLYNDGVNFSKITDYFNKINAIFDLQDSKIFLYNKSGIVGKAIKDINGKFEIINKNIATDINFSTNRQQFQLKTDISSNMLSSSYNASIELSSTKEMLKYSGSFELQNNQLYKMTGKINSSGSNIGNILKLFSNNQRKYQDDDYKLNGIVNYENESLKISELNYESKENKINSEILYNKQLNQLDIKINSQQLKIFDFTTDVNLFELKDKMIDGESNSLASQIENYYKYLENFNYNLDIKIDKVNLSQDDFISSFNLSVVSQNKKTLIKKIDGKYNDKFQIKAVGDILNNGIRNQFRLKITVPLSANNEKLDVTAIYFDNYLMVNNLVFIKDGQSVLAKFKINFNNAANLVSGEANIINYNLNEFIKKYKSFTKNDTEDQRGILNNLLLLINKIKLISDIKITLKNSTINRQKVEKIVLNINSDESRIIGKLKLEDKRIFLLDTRYELYLDDLKPYVDLDLSGDYFNVRNFLKIFDIKNELQNYLILTNQELRASNDKSLWRDIKIDFANFLNINFSIKSNLSNIIFDALTINSFTCDVVGRHNIGKFDQCVVKIDYGSINAKGNLNMESKTFASIINVDSINFNSFTKEKKEQPTLMSATGRFFANGDDVQAFVKNSSGNFEYLLYNKYIDNLNLNLFADSIHNSRAYSDLVSLTERATVSGNTSFKEMNGSLEINNGVLTTNFQFSNERVAGAGIFNISGQSSVFKGLMRVAFIPKGYKNVIYSDLNWNGNFYNINKNFDIEKLKGILGSG